MSEQTLQDITAQKVMQLSEEEASKVLIFIAGLNAGVKLKKKPSKRNNIKPSNVMHDNKEQVL